MGMAMLRPTMKDDCDAKGKANKAIKQGRK